MIETSKLPSTDFEKNFQELEGQYVNEIEGIISAQLFEKGHLAGDHEKADDLEFFGRTNYKIRLKQPNKNVWSVPIQLLKKSIRKVLRNGGNIEEGVITGSGKKKSEASYEMPIKLLLKSIPGEEFQKRTFVGNTVDHKVYGEGIIKGINDTGNVEVKFPEREVLLKPEFCKLKKM